MAATHPPPDAPASPRPPPPPKHTNTHTCARTRGPRTGTPYEGGLFRLRLSLPPDFPASPPKGWFSTRIWHPNVAADGEICVNVLKRDWAPALGLRHVLCVVRCLLIDPNPESALNEEAGVCVWGGGGGEGGRRGRAFAEGR
jgi:ubiquitin-conjugating enzyme E2 S